MANQYTLTNDFAEIEEEKGTLYNKGDSAIELASTADTAKGAGILLLTGERRTFSGTLYARSMDEEGLLNVADFKDGGEGGEDNLSGVPLGSILPYSANAQTPPYGFLYCEGQEVSRTLYPDLFALIGTTYGAGDGSTTFNLPNLIEAAMLNGSYTKTNYTTAGSATFTAPKTGFYKITVKGGGGGGFGASSNSGYRVGGYGGGEGGTTIAYEKMTKGQTASVVVGAGGAGGAVGAAGEDGGNSIVTINNATYIGGGGSRSFGGSGTIYGAAGGVPNGTTSMEATAQGGNGGGEGGGNGAVGVHGGGGGGGTTLPNGTATIGFAGGDGYATIEYIGISMKYIGKVYDAPTPSSAQIDLSQYAQDLANRLTREQTPAFNRRDVITTSGTYTAPVTGWYRIVVKGGGGGGQGGTMASSYTISGASGGEGGTSIGYERMAAGDTAIVVIGAGGAGGAINGVAGANGGNSTCTVNSTTYTGGGGYGGSSSAAGGGAGDIVGAPGQPRGYLPVAPGVAGNLRQSGGGNGGIGIGTLNGVNGGGGCSGGVVSSAAQTGCNGGNGYVWFEYWDGSLN